MSKSGRKISDEEFLAVCDSDSHSRSIACASLLKLASDMDVSPLDLGKTADRLSIKIRQCQLGLMRGKSGDRDDSPVPERVRGTIEGLSENGSITCAKVWKAADTLGLEKEETRRCCDVLGIKIRSCHLGIF